MRYLVSCILLSLIACELPAQVATATRAADRPGVPDPRARPGVAAARLESPIHLDGSLDDAGWTGVPVVDAFTQRDPEEGRPSGERTEVRIAYDDEALYVGARLHDEGGVTSRLGRRDMGLASSDWFRVSLDSYLDRRTAFRFDVNPSGVRRDAVISTGTAPPGSGGFAGPDGDLAWDAVWSASTTSDARGWTVEMRIPLSQLRFRHAEDQVWGIQLERIIDRTQELSVFSFTPKSEVGGVAAFGELSGLRGLQPGRRLELIPYVVSRGQFVDTRANALRGDRELQADGGLDARYRVTSDVTLAATVNPDFGQVEVDPAVINLTAYETRYEEKRPFFVEGLNSFRFGGNVMGPGATNLLYSRRIGRAPQLRVPGEQADVPAVARILGAAKLAGKTSSGWSIGVLDAVTNAEHGRYLDPDGETRSVMVEPLTNYFAGVLHREIRRGETAFGGMFTAVNRRLPDGDPASALRSAAYTGGVDFSHEWANRTWQLGGFVVGSRVVGSEGAMLATQRASSRYYQRPDASSFRVDPHATSLEGLSSTVRIQKQSGTHLTGDWWIMTTTPGFESNDLGFQQRSDRTATGGGFSYAERRPGRVLRSWSVFTAAEVHANYDGDWIDKKVYTSIRAQALNYWNASAQLRYEPERMDDRLTRGGPLARRPAGGFLQLSLASDPRAEIGGSVAVSMQANRGGSESRQARLAIDVRTSPRWNLSLGPEIQAVHEDAQYVATIADPRATSTFGSRYVFAPLDQTELSVVTRLDWTFTPNLSLQLYAQPLVSHAEFGAPKSLTAPGVYDFEPYPGEVADRSFTTRSLRGNAVLRWEYRAGSTFYLVWQQERLDTGLIPDFEIDSALRTIFDARANNVLALKWTYWFSP